jgi:Glyoxalase/Bleomycin resistance protein/Dioxygenase superfamily
MIGPLAGCRVIQLGCVVRDLDASIAVYGGEWLRFPASPPSFYRDLRYVGGEAVLDHAVALRKREHPQVELIQPGVGRNVWADWIEEGHEGLHHLAVSVEEPYGAIPAMEAAGYECLMAGKMGNEGGEFAYFDTCAALGIVLEALRLPASLRS